MSEEGKKPEEQVDEAKQARYQRDTAIAESAKLKQQLKELESKVLSDEDRALFDKLRADADKAEEDRQKKAGEFESLKQNLLKKHQDEIETERKARLALEESYRAEKIEAAFLGATDWFGGETAKTILTGDMANAYLGKYVAYEDVEIAGKTIKAVVVRDIDGNIIVDGKGNPARFAEAIGELITQLPNKDRILRGSGKTGSGSSGGATGGREVDFRNLTPEQRRDPKVLAALRASLPRGGVIMGEAYDR